MESPLEFLHRKKIIDDDKTKWIVTFDDGRQFDIVELITEYAQPPKSFAALRARRSAIMSDLMADDIADSIALYKHDVELFFEQNPDWQTPNNIECLNLPKL